jgi:glycosyltransferase involved in cell wall biosynthesis
MSRVVIVCETFSPNMGYLTAVLPKFLARRRFEVHVISLDLVPYSSDAEWQGKAPDFLARQVAAAGSRYGHNGFTVHILKHGHIGRYPYARGLVAKLRELAPDVVYSAVAIGALPIQCALGKLAVGYQLFTGSHTSPSTFPLATLPHPFLTSAGLRCLFMRWLPGRLVSYLTRKCYARTDECGVIARRFFGVQPRKIVVVPLGVDTDYFHPVRTPDDIQERQRVRADLGVAEDEILCVYSGRLVGSKRAPMLARAVERLRQEGLPFRTLFIGDGPEKPLVQSPLARVVDLVPFSELAPYYRASDVAVWPGTESTSIFDASACGIPVVCNERIAPAHLLGNGLAHAHDDLDDLVRCLRQLADPERRRAFGEIGAHRALHEIGWDVAAAIRERDFREALEQTSESLEDRT